MDLTDDFTRLVPGLLHGLYLVGSVALDDYHPGRSDIDFVGVLREPPSPEQLASLRAAHRELSRRRPRPYFDGCYVTLADLAAGPDATPARPAVHEHRFSPSTRFALDEVTWHTLSRHGVTVQGPPLTELPIRRDEEALREWTRRNVRAYWQPWIRTRRRLPFLSDWAVAWGVLGVSRMRYTVDTADITSKRGAGEYALQVYDSRWHPIIEEALHLRRGDSSRFSSRRLRRRAALDFLNTAVQLDNR